MCTNIKTHRNRPRKTMRSFVQLGVHLERRVKSGELHTVRSEELMCRHSRRIKFMPRLKGELSLPKKGFGSSYAESFFLCMFCKYT